MLPVGLVSCQACVMAWIIWFFLLVRIYSSFSGPQFYKLHTLFVGTIFSIYKCDKKFRPDTSKLSAYVLLLFFIFPVMKLVLLFEQKSHFLLGFFADSRSIFQFKRPYRLWGFICSFLSYFLWRSFPMMIRDPGSERFDLIGSIIETSII